MNRRCRTCGVELPPKEGKGAPRRYCDLHAPPRRQYHAAYYGEHRERLLAYQRAYAGSRPLLERVCACGRVFRGWLELCSSCRQRQRRRGSHPVHNFSSGGGLG